jgi:hypothetical protein
VFFWESDFVPGRPGTEEFDFCSCPYPGTKGHRDKKISLSRGNLLLNLKYEVLILSDKNSFISFLYVGQVKKSGFALLGKNLNLKSFFLVGPFK